VAFTGLAGALGAIQRVEFGHVRLRQGEVENLRVLTDPFLAGRLGNDQQIMLEAPAQQDLRGRAADSLSRMLSGLTSR